MSTSALIRRMLNDGTIDAHVALGTLFDTYGTGNTPLTAWAAALDTAMLAVTTAGTAVATAATAINVANLTHAFSSGALAEGTNAATFKTTATVNYCIASVHYTKGATDNVGFTAAAAQGTLTNCIYLVCLDSAGTFSTVKGTAAASNGAPSIPAPTAGTCPIGYIHVSLANAATFTAATTDLSASDVTGTYINQIGGAAQGATITTAIATLTTAVATMNTAIHTTLNAALVAAIPPAL